MELLRDLSINNDRINCNVSSKPEQTIVDQLAAVLRIDTAKAAQESTHLAQEDSRTIEG